MGIVTFAALLVLGVVSASNLIIARKPDAKELIAKLAPYQGWIDSWDDIGFEEPEVTTRVDVADYIELRTKALLAHATQIDPDSFWFAVPDEIHRKVYPWEDYTLIESRVETDHPEDDLFSGI